MFSTNILKHDIFDPAACDKQRDCFFISPLFRYRRQINHLHILTAAPAACKVRDANRARCKAGGVQGARLTRITQNGRRAEPEYCHEAWREGYEAKDHDECCVKKGRRCSAALIFFQSCVKLEKDYEKRNFYCEFFQFQPKFA